VHCCVSFYAHPLARELVRSSIIVAVKKVTINQQDIHSIPFIKCKPENKTQCYHSTRTPHLLVHGRCAALSEIGFGRLGLSDTLGEKSSILVLQKS